MPEASAYSIRPFSTIADFRACVDLQEATWGIGFSERVSPAILKVGQILGGVSAGAYDADGALVGFVFGLTGVRDGEVVHWSDMLAVRPEARDSGLGRLLKAYQRQRVMALGIEKMFWTFDPLRSRNAHLNLTRLGIVVREYAENMYGDTDSPLHRGIGTDRFIALWLLGSDRVRRAVAAIEGAPSAGSPPDSGSLPESGSPAESGSVPPTPGPPDDLWPSEVAEAPMVLAGEDADGPLRPGAPELHLSAPALRVAIPTDLDAVMQADLNTAVAWREATRAVFAHYLENGYEVRYFRRGAPTSWYGLARRTDR